MPGEGSQPVDFLEWDTAFFGHRIARVRGETLCPKQAADVDAWCREHSIECLYFLARADDSTTTSVAEANGFHLVDIRLTFERTLAEGAWAAPKRREPAPANLRPVAPADLTALQRIARESYHDTRFYHDRHFSAEQCDALYETWISKSCQGDAQLVLVADWNGKPAGFITCHLGPRGAGGSIGLVGVDAEAQGRGIGQSLVRDALTWFRTQEATSVTVVTQGRNIAAQRLYERSGFLIRGVQLWYHKWFPSAHEAATR